MADRVIRGYWDCPQCGTKGIDGLIDVCPGCGSAKDKNVRYYMKKVEAVSEEELEAAGISKEESDGSHREWVCAFCGSLNNYRDEFCAHCGAAKAEKEQDYGGDTSQVQYRRDKDGTLHQTGRPEPEAKESSYTTVEEVKEKERRTQEAAAARKRSSTIRIAIVALVALLAIFFLWPHTVSESITGFDWQRTVYVEELKTFSESGWTLPAGARQTDSRMEFYGYQQVFDHYETVYETRIRQVLDHYESSYTYTDNGNGTFSEHEVRTPVYRNETYQEPVQQAVYRNEPVYQRKYYYDIDRWEVVGQYDTSGSDHDPYWSTEYTLTSNQRDTDRTESYYTTYNDTDRQRVSYDQWASQDIGDGIYVTSCRLGIEYSRKEQA